MTAYRVLLAGLNRLDLCEAKTELDRKGAEGIVATSVEEAISLANVSNFDVAVIEIRPDLRAAFDGLELLRKLKDVPVAAAVEGHDTDSAILAVELGAVDILHLPISKQQDRLSTLWQHALRKRKEHESSNRLGELSSSDTCQPQPFLDSASEDLVKSFIPSLFDSDSDCEDGHSFPSARTAVDVCDNSEINSQGTALHWQSSSPLSSALSSGVDTSSQGSFGNSTSLSGFQSFTEVSMGLTDMSGFHSVLSVSSGILDASSSEDERQSKKSKVDCTQPLHTDFCKVADSLGIEVAAPSNTLEHIGDSAAGLATQTVASHLQKDRMGKRGRSASLPSRAPHNLAPELGLLCPAHVSATPSLTGTITEAVAPAASLPAAGDYWQPAPTRHQPAQGTVAYQNPGPWPAPPGMIPTAPLTAFYPQQCPQLATPPAPQQLVQSTQAVNVTAALAELLNEAPKMKPPLGLKLDKNSVLEELNRLRAGSASVRR